MSRDVSHASHSMCKSASCSNRRCSRGNWKNDLASGLSRVDGPIKEMYRYQWGISCVSSNKRYWGMGFILPILRCSCPGGTPCTS
jgi:hypothetical protein